MRDTRKGRRTVMATASLHDLYVSELKDALSAEQQILNALPRMEKASSHEQLQKAFRKHREVTEEHVSRLETIMESLDEKARGKKCKGIAGILDEGEELMNDVDGDARDAALIAAAQRVEHYEIALYGALRAFANQLGRPDDARLLQKTLDEEGKADKELTRIAESRVNQDAMA
jgi:ferritin-like metal-binding protein YciE